MRKTAFLLCILLTMVLSGCKDPMADGTTQYTTTEEPASVMTPTMVDDSIPMDESGILSYIHNKYIEDGIQQQIYNFQENILISSTFYDGKTGDASFILELVSTQTGEIIYQIEQKNVELPMIQILDRHIIVSDMVTGKVSILDDKLRVEKEYETAQGASFLNRLMTKAFVLDQKNGILVMDLEDGTSKRWTKEMERAYISRVCGDYVTLVYTDSKTGLSASALLNLAAEEVDLFDIDKSLYGVEHNSRVWLAGIVGESDCYLYGTEENPQLFKTDYGTTPNLVINSDDIILTKTLEDGSVDLTACYPDGTFRSKMNLPGGVMGYWGNLVWFESLHGYLLTCIDETGVDKLYYWDTSIPAEGKGLVFSEMESEPETGEVLAQNLYEKAKTIGEKYGVSIKIADQCETEYDSYTVEQNLNEDKIVRGLDIIDLSLSSYPEGFIRQLQFGFFREIEINLMGSIYAADRVDDNKNGFDSFIAFVQQHEEKYVMVFDLGRGQLMEQDLYHEFSHLIDKKLQNQLDQGKKLKYSEEAWAALNPEEFTYTYSYTDVPPSYYYDGYDDYFVDIYSRTFPTEDRARILEYAMIGAEFCFDTYPGLVDKLEYYCECIRDGFDTTGWPEVTKWEEMLLLVD